jgi:tetratricopeptide (TPR) repeat protein
MSEVYELFQEGRKRLARGDVAQAIVPLERARRREPAKASIREALGCAYLRLRRYEEAEAEFGTLLDLAPNDHYGYYLLGRAQQGLGRTDLARGSYKMASWLRPSCEDYRLALESLPRGA